MSKYTTEVRFLCESLTGHDESKDYSSIDEIIEDALPIIFSFDFPIFDEEYREVLETKILRHYYTREIGCETYGLWKLRLQTKLNEIMPYYNKLYESELLKYDPLRDVDMTTQHTGQRTGERTDINSGEISRENSLENSEEISRENSTLNASNDKSQQIDSKNIQEQKARENSIVGNDVENDNRTNQFTGSRSSEHEENNISATETTGGHSNTNQDLYSDTPQGALTGVDNMTYLTNARKISDAGSTTGSTDTTEIGKGKNSITDSNTESSSGNRIKTNETQENGTDTNDTKETGNSLKTNEREETVFGKSSDVSSSTSSGSASEKNTSTAIGKSHNTEDYVMRVFGKSAGHSYAKMLKEFRDNLLNIDMDIIRDLADLFMLIW